MQVENVCLLHEYITINILIAACLIRVFPPDLLGQWNRSVPLMHPLNCYAPLPRDIPGTSLLLVALIDLSFFLPCPTLSNQFLIFSSLHTLSWDFSYAPPHVYRFIHYFKIMKETSVIM